MTLIFNDTLFLGASAGIFNVKEEDYSVLGSPTIDEYGILTANVNANDGFQTSITWGDLLNKSWRIKACSYSNGQTSNNPFGFILINNFVSVRVAWDRVYFYFNTGTTEEYTENQFVRLSVPPMGWYDIEISFDILTGVYSLTLINAQTGEVFAAETTEASTTNKEIYFINSSPTNKINVYGVLKNSELDLNSFKIFIESVLNYQPCLKIPYKRGKYGLKVPDYSYKERVIEAYDNGEIELFFDEKQKG